MMNQLIGLLLPSLISLERYKRIDGESRNKKIIIVRYLRSVLFNNLIAYVITIYFFRKPEFVFTNQFTVKYLILAMVIAYIFPTIEKLIKSNIEIDLKVEKNEEKN